MLTPKMVHNDISAHHAQFLNILEAHPWLIPTLTLLHTLPLIVAAPAFWKNRALSKRLKIEREKTKQLTLQQVDKVTTAAQTHHCHHPFCSKLKFKQH